jgi:hypothetical protein
VLKHGADGIDQSRHDEALRHYRMSQLIDPTVPVLDELTQAVGS